MRLYADRGSLRLRQLAADLGLVAWVVVWSVVARTVHGAVLVLAEPGQAVQRLAGSIAGSMASASSAAHRVPGVGGALSRPFDALGQAGSSVGGTGASVSSAVTTLAAVLAVVLVVLPVGWLLLRWLPWRLGWAREAGAAARLLAAEPEPELLAARALATAPLPELARLPAGTAARWRAGDPAAVRALADLELRRLGLRRPPAAAARAGQSAQAGPPACR
jgi:hypothetical protein